MLPQLPMLLLPSPQSSNHYFTPIATSLSPELLHLAHRPAVPHPANLTFVGFLHVRFVADRIAVFYHYQTTTAMGNHRQFFTCTSCNLGASENSLTSMTSRGLATALGHVANRKCKVLFDAPKFDARCTHLTCTQPYHRFRTKRAYDVHTAQCSQQATVDIDIVELDSPTAQLIGTPLVDLDLVELETKEAAAAAAASASAAASAAAAMSAAAAESAAVQLKLQSDLDDARQEVETLKRKLHPTEAESARSRSNRRMHSPASDVWLMGIEPLPTQGGLGEIGCAYRFDPSQPKSPIASIALAYKITHCHSRSIGSAEREQAALETIARHPTANFPFYHGYARIMYPMAMGASTKVNHEPAKSMIVHGICMEFIPGLSLSQLLKSTIDGQLSKYQCIKTLMERLKLCTQLARGIAHMHQLGIIHGDIKPGNVMIVAEDIYQDLVLTSLQSSAAQQRRLPLNFLATRLVAFPPASAASRYV